MANTVPPLDEGHEESQGSTPSFIDLIVLPLYRGRWIILVTMAFAFCASLAYAVIQPNFFVVTAKLLVRLGEREQITTDLVARRDAPVNRTVAFDDIQNELHILNNPRVFERVAQGVGPERILAPYDPAASLDPNLSWPRRKIHEIQSWWFRRQASASGKPEGAEPDPQRLLEAAQRRLRAGTRIAGEGGSSIISVRYAAHDPLLARDVVESLVEEMLRQHQKVFSTNPGLQILQRAFESKKVALKQAEAALREFRLEKKVFDLEAEREGVIEQRTACQAQLQESEQGLAEAKARVRRLESILADYPPTLRVKRDPIMTENTEWSRKQADLDGLEVEREKLVNTWGVNNFRVTEVDAAIRLLKSELDGMQQFITRPQGDETIDNPDYVRTKALLDEVRVQEDGLRAKIEVLKGQIENLERRLAVMSTSEEEYRNLNSTTRILREQADDLESKLERFKVTHSLDEEMATNLLVMQQPEVPRSKAGPSRPRYLIFGMFLGFALGAGVAFLLSALDHSLRRPEEVERVLGVKVLTTVPVHSAWRRAMKTLESK